MTRPSSAYASRLAAAIGRGTQLLPRRLGCEREPLRFLYQAYRQVIALYFFAGVRAGLREYA